MVGFYYYPILILQGLCLIHAYRNHTAQKWFFIIIFIPVVGCIIYLYENFYNRSTISIISEGIKQVVISNYKIEQLEKQVRFSDSVRNKVSLADAYLQNGRYKEAIDLYESCRGGFMDDDTGLKIKLVHALFLHKEYNRCVEMGRSLEGDKEFKTAVERISFVWALYYTGLITEAEKNFIAMDHSFSNYVQRYQFCVFLKMIGKTDEAKQKVAELKDEILHMKGNERRIHRDIIGQIRALD